MNAHLDDDQQRLGRIVESQNASVPPILPRERIPPTYPRERGEVYTEADKVLSQRGALSAASQHTPRSSHRAPDSSHRGTASEPSQERPETPRGSGSGYAGDFDDRKAAGRKVLIADDNRDSAESIAMIFRIYGHDVAVVYDGEAAVATFAAFQPSFVLLDIGMPKLNGYEAAKRIRAAAGTRAVTLVALTGWGQESDKERAFAAGFDHHFTKPVDPERLGALITD